MFLGLLFSRMWFCKDCLANCVRFVNLGGHNETNEAPSWKSPRSLSTCCLDPHSRKSVLDVAKKYGNLPKQFKFKQSGTFSRLRLFTRFAYLGWIRTGDSIRSALFMFCSVPSILFDVFRKRVRTTGVRGLFLYQITVVLSSILPLLLIPSWALVIVPFLVSCATSSAMLMTSHTTPGRDQ